MRQSSKVCAGIAAGLSILALAACGSSAGSEGGSSKVTLGSDGVLSKEVTVKISIPGKVLPMLPVVMANKWGEFKKRGINVDVSVNLPADGTALMTTGKVDASWGGPTVGIFNAIASGADVRIVAPGNQPTKEVGTGFWVSTKALGGKKFDPSMLKGKKVASSSGNSNTSMLAFTDMIKSGGLSVSDVELVTMASSDMIPALENGSIFAGVVSEPANVPLEEAGSATRIWPSIPEGWPNTALFFGPTLLRDNPDVGKAFVAALRATYANDLQGDYLKDPTKLKDISVESEQPVDVLKQSTSDVYPATMAFPDTYVARHESVWRQWPNLLTSTKPFAESDVIDSRFMEYANSQN
jgi:NitT/TauT family transport system substrate-binding protein